MESNELNADLESCSFSDECSLKPSSDDSGFADGQVSDNEGSKSLLSENSDGNSLCSASCNLDQSQEEEEDEEEEVYYKKKKKLYKEFPSISDTDCSTNIECSHEGNINDAGNSSMQDISGLHHSPENTDSEFLSKCYTNEISESDSSSDKFSTPKSDISSKNKSTNIDKETDNSLPVLVRRSNIRTSTSSLILSSSSDDDDDEDDETELRNILPINGNLDNENDDDDDDSDNDDNEKYSRILGGNSLSDTWNCCKLLQERETGRMNSRKFINDSSGSLSLVRRLTLDCKLKFHKGCVNALNFNKSGTLLASGADDLKIAIWKLKKKKPHITYESGHTENVFQSKFLPFSGDCHVVSCARDGQVRLAQLSVTDVCKNTKKLAQHKGAAHKLALMDDSAHTFYSCGEDAAVFEVDIRTDKAEKLCVVKVEDKKIRVDLNSIHANPFKSYEFCVGGRDRYVRIYDKRMIKATDEPAMKKYCPHHMVDKYDPHITACVYNYNGTEIVASYNDESIYLFDADHSDGADYIKSYQGHRNSVTIKGINFYGPKSEYVLSGSDCGHLFIWDKESERIVQFLSGDVSGVVNVLEPHPYYPILATAGLDHDIKLWMPNSPSETELPNLKKYVKQNMRAKEMNRPYGIFYSFLRSLRGSAYNHE